MPAIKSELGKQDRRRAAPGQAYELGKFARKHRLSKDQAKRPFYRRVVIASKQTHSRAGVDTYACVKEQR